MPGVVILLGLFVWFCRSDQASHARRSQTEEKAKVVAAVWETEFIKPLAMLASLHQDDMKKGMFSSYSPYRLGAILHLYCHGSGAISYIFQIDLVQNSSRSNELNQFCPPRSSDGLSLLSLSFFYEARKSVVSKRFTTVQSVHISLF